MPKIDPRLLDCDSKEEITENFNRILALIDGLEPEPTPPEDGGETT